MIPALLLAAVVSKPISFTEAAAWMLPPTLVASVLTEREIAAGRAHEVNPLMNTRGKRLVAQAGEVTLCSLIVHKLSVRNRAAGRWGLRIFVGLKVLDAGWDVHVTVRR